MSIASTSAIVQSQRKVAEAVLLYCRSAVTQGRKKPAILVCGEWHEDVKGPLLADLQKLGTSARSALLSTPVAQNGGASSILDLGQDVLAQGLRAGEFDLIALTAEAELFKAEREIMANLKKLLPKDGLLLLELGITSAAGNGAYQDDDPNRTPGRVWKDALSGAGFHSVMARSDRSTDDSGRDIFLARSDGVRALQVLPPAVIPLADLARIRDTITSILGQLLQIPPGELDRMAAFTEFGVDSIGGVAFTKELNRQLGMEVKPTLLFDYASIDKLAAHIVAEGLASLPAPTENVSPPAPVQVCSASPRLDPVAFQTVSVSARPGDIAVIGFSGRFPAAANVDEFWQNLAQGKNCITEVPIERWDHAHFFESDSKRTDRTNSKWGGFVADADKFDPLFFNLSGREAEATDPQHRLFLEECYHALETAGYAGPSSSLPKKCGVFVGVEPGDYLSLLLGQQWPEEKVPIFQGNAESILAARISYFLDLKGPSIAINTACSSSLVAIHLACQSISNGDCDLALAGGVRVFTSEKAYLALGNMGMLSPEGQCKTFDADANGFVPGEAVGVIVLKSLAAALRDGDQIQGVIKGSAINQDGKTNGITAPSSLSQTQVELEAYEKAGINPETIQYIEAHGTGTKLGDPIEVHALTQSFRRFTPAERFCGIGSVKTNVGHTMAAAGVCSVIKVLLSLRHRQIPPSLNLQQPNPYIDFDRSPFVVNTQLRDWVSRKDAPRRAAISSFGFSGTNCHLVLDEAPDPPRLNQAPSKPAYLFTLSGKTPEALVQQIEALNARVQGAGLAEHLEDISFTLNVGRSHFAHRCAVVAESVEKLAGSLTALIQGAKAASAWRGEANGEGDKDAVIHKQIAGFLLKELSAEPPLGPATYREKLSALAALYVKGFDPDWQLLHAGDRRRRISLPVYPFARERYWPGPLPENSRIRSTHLHPLVHVNKSTLDQTVFASAFDGREFFLADHQINEQKVLPGVAYLEWARVAAGLATGRDQIGLRNVGWIRPLRCESETEDSIRLIRDGDGVRFEIVSGPGASVHSQGRITFESIGATPREEIARIKSRCWRTELPATIYRRCAEAGLKLGASFRTIQQVWFSDTEALSYLELPTPLRSGIAAFGLHPGLMDGALQTTAVLGGTGDGGLPVPFAIGEVHGVCREPTCYAHVKLLSTENGLRRFNISLLNDSGEILVELRDLAMRAFRPEITPPNHAVILARPVWHEMPLPPNPAAALEGSILLLDNSDVLESELRKRYPGCELTRVGAGESFHTEKNRVTMSPSREGDYDKLLGVAMPAVVIHRWATPDSPDPLECGIFSIFFLTRALMRQKGETRVCILFVYPPDAHPAFAAVGAYARTLRLERPSVVLRTVCSPGLTVDQLAQELAGRSGDGEVRYTAGQREVRALESFSLEPVGDLALREKGVYFITGGGGGLGLVFAQYLARTVRARLVLFGRSQLTQAQAVRCAAMEGLGSEVFYLRGDVASVSDVTRAVGLARDRFGRIDGVIHAAGVIHDGFIMQKSSDDFRSVLRPKLNGAMALETALRGVPLDFMVLFSSIAAVLGNVGQSDYAYANAFLNEFAAAREERRKRGESIGRTLSLNWPLWLEGGMRQSEQLQTLKLTRFGLAPLKTEIGLDIFEQALRSNESQIIALFGEPDKARNLLLPPLEAPVVMPAKTAEPTASTDWRAPLLGYLTNEFSKMVKLPASRIQPREALEKYGIDSIMVMEFTQRLEKDFGELSKTLLFEHQTLGELAEYFLHSHSGQVARLVGVPPVLDRQESGPASAALPLEVMAPPPPLPASRDEIAIIGVFGRFPMADDLDQFWENLYSGKDCIQEIPLERWDYRLFYDPEPGKPGKTQNKWGGFLKDFERFDAQFFSITPKEAIALDPQERLFLETVWRTVEDAGYRKSTLSGKKVGVFAGVMYGEYQLYGAGDPRFGNVFPLSSSYASIANRVSYFFNWHGPSMALDTMCSSSLTAIHLACESLHRGESELAIAGGVNVTVHPHKDILLSPGGFAASDGRCRSFGEGGDGYVPGEGVGTVLLKPLRRALADGDHIHGVIKATSVNHGGKTNGYTVPNPKAQAELIRDALAQGKIDSRTISYIEAHGTGTALGDPIEITALTKAFQETAEAPLAEGQHCVIGSVKSNIGHLESAAGIAGVVKVLLQMRHAQFVPSLHSARLNPNIHFRGTAFHVQQSVEPWRPLPPIKGMAVPRRAGISSFGAGGANAHVIVEEFQSVGTAGDDAVGLIVLSARNPDRLQARARQLLDWLVAKDAGTLPSLADIAWTLQTGREPFEERLAFVAGSIDELIERLRQASMTTTSPEIHRGTFRPGRDTGLSFLEGDEGRAVLDLMIQNQKWDKLAQFWVAGGEVEWEKIHASKRRRVPLPSYPFAGERYWAPDLIRAAAEGNGAVPAAPVIPPASPGPEPIYYRPIWADQPAPAPEPLNGLIWLFDAEPAFREHLRVCYPALQVVRVQPGAGFHFQDGLITIDPAADADFQRLVASGVPNFIIHRWVTQARDLNDGLALGVMAMLRLARALVAHPLNSRIHWLIVSPASRPEFDAISGFAKSLAQEQPKLQLRTVVTNRSDDIVTELLSRDTWPEVRWVNGIRQARTLESFTPAPSLPPPIKKQGVYLITGGLGGLGLIFAMHLARNYQANLVLSGRSELSDSGRARLADLESLGAKAVYVRGDVAEIENARACVREARTRFGRLDGIVHTAGVIHDGFLLKKTDADFKSVLAPKVHGVVALEEASSGETLDFFVMCSSTAGLLGNGGQSDYAFANAFMDAYARMRQARGRTVSINWPLWSEGGMKADNTATYLAALGLAPLPSDAGIAMLEAVLRSGETQVMPLWGFPAKVKAHFAPSSRDDREPIVSGLDPSLLAPRIEDYLKGALAAVTHLPIGQIDALQRFEEIGVDSIVVSDFNLKLAKEIGVLPKTLLFEYPNLHELASHLAVAHPALFARLVETILSPPAVVESPRVIPLEAKREPELSRPPVDHDIAIIGLAGRYPQAEDVPQFWENLKAGKHCVTEIPKDRWDIDRYYDSDPHKAAEGKIYCRWGAFVDDVDKFDPLFFNIAPIEAELMDPQERLFLETAWAALEDAGYTRQDLARWTQKEFTANVGVFVGVTNNTYLYVARDNGGDRFLPTTLPWSIANRVSYLFNFNGPSIPVDTACSSSLTAIHLACEAIRKGECAQAIAGGVNLYLHPAKYVSLCVMRMLSSHGRCQTFGDGGDGFVPGEGVGAVLLKPLSRAVADGDHIYGVIKGTAINHGGRTNGYTVPNPHAQADLISLALASSGIDPDTVTCIEAHGTGTVLGDPIEVAGLDKAFRARDGSINPARPACSLGSVKSNIGHLEAAAGIAGLTKLLMQLQHRQLAPSLHSDPPNPNITFTGTPFRVQRHLEDWTVPEVNGRSICRRAGISSFGAGGANAHVIVEEYVSAARTVGRVSSSPVLIVLSAKNSERLRLLASNLHQYLHRFSDSERPVDSIAFTLQLGRESLEERIAFLAGTREELQAKLALIRDESAATSEFFRGRVKRERGTNPSPPAVLKPGEWEKAAQAWTTGVDIAWEVLWKDRKPLRVSLPSYPFARQRYWVPVLGKHESPDAIPAASHHPLVHRNESTLKGQLYGSSFTGKEVVFRDHRVGGQRMFPGAASLELALAGSRLAASTDSLSLRDVVWTRAIVASENNTEIRLGLQQPKAGSLSFEIRNAAGELCVQGKTDLNPVWTAEKIDWPSVRSRCSRLFEADELYTGFAARGLEYGEGFRVIRQIASGTGEVWSQLEVPSVWKGQNFWLHPALVDGALQSLAVIGAGGDGLEIPFAVQEVSCPTPLPSRCFAWAQAGPAEGGVRRYDVKWVDEAGNVLARLGGLMVRRYEKPSGELVYYRPVWHRKAAPITCPEPGPTLIFDESESNYRELEKTGVALVRVIPGTSYERNGSLVKVRLDQPEDYERLVADVMPRQIIHSWSKSGQDLEEGLARGIYSIHLLSQALLRQRGGDPPRLVFVYPVGEAIYEGVGGYAKSLRQEQPRLVWKTVGIDTPNQNQSVLAELGGEGEEVRYLNGVREVRAIEETSVRKQNPGIKQGGVYLITGGAGGLGRIFAEHLVNTHHAKVVLAGRSELSADKEAWIKGLGAIYVRVDLSERAGAEEAVQAARSTYGRLDGVLHAAGELRDGLIWKKSLENFARVVRSKVRTALILEEAGGPVDWILFSSTAGLMGNAGQSDYAYANACLDAFAREREQRRGRGGCRTVSINWPFWQSGGMKTSDEALRFQEQKLGLLALPTENGLAAFTNIIESGETQCAVFFSLPGKLKAQFKPMESPHAEPPASLSHPMGEGRGEGFPLSTPLNTKSQTVQVINDLKSLVAKVLRLDVTVLEADADLSEYGFDSITFTTLANEINALLGLEITPAHLFEYTTLQSFASHLLQEHASKLAARYTPSRSSLPALRSFGAKGGGNEAQTSSSVPITPALTPALSHPMGEGEVGASTVRTDRSATSDWVPAPSPIGWERAPLRTQSTHPPREPIAIIGMSGIFPGSPDLEAFWQHLDRGTDLITRAPSDRWTHSGASPQIPTLAMDAPWGGFIPDIDKFDPLFFDISPREAELMDPQQRLFLQTVWKAIEDSGHSKSDFAATKTGLFVGVAANDYATLLALGGVEVEAYSSTGNAHSVLANRVSYFFDLNGPSEAIDTACSSSLVAIHRAIESIQSGSSEMAIVGGVNVLLSPGAFLAFGKAGMLCDDGRCKTFDERANGYVRGEGIGAIVLKPLSRAQADGDHVYALILGSAENHGGHVQSLTVPNPNAQARLLQDAYARAGIDPYSISFIEAHGTGTSLGDPIEINGLKKSFGTNSGEIPAPRCAVGSVKTNIGHLETAAGIAGVIKVLLAMRHQRIPGNVHLQRLNPYIQVEGSPFYFPQVSQPWELLRTRDGHAMPRRAGISSFGFGGSNAHVILEEYANPQSGVPSQSSRPELVLLSARDNSQLIEIAANLAAHLERDSELTLAAIAYTSQVGRESFDHRLALIVSTRAELIDKLARMVAGENPSGTDRGTASELKAGLALLRQVHDSDDFLRPFLQTRDLAKLARLWISGVDVDWKTLWQEGKPLRVSLPTYPFARQRYWVPTGRPSAPSDVTASPSPFPKKGEGRLSSEALLAKEEREGFILPPRAETPPIKLGRVAASVPPIPPTVDKSAVTDFLIRQFAVLTKLSPEQIKPLEPIEKYGFDSILAVEFTTRLEKDFGELSKTLLFEYQTIDTLADYFLKRHRDQLLNVLKDLALPASEASSSTPSSPSPFPQKGEGRGEGSLQFFPEPITSKPSVSPSPSLSVAPSLHPSVSPSLRLPQEGPTRDDIAIIGLAGRYPQADTLDEFWANLCSGKDCIEEIPADRWNFETYYDPNPTHPGTSANKWGGFLRDIDKFDPLFFNISPREAEAIDPQERLFLETAWNTVEDAGYSKSTLGGKRIGVFVGVMYGQYQLFGVEESVRRGQVVTFSSSYASIANRVSYFFDWQGPSFALDSMCSSALMSIHLACESIRRGESELALAGGVNAILHPHKDIGLSQAGFLNPDGKCRSFGKSGARGYVAGEGVGAVLLKPLASAIRDGDHIHGVIKATAANHGGRSNGYTVPNPNAQADLIARGLSQAGINPDTISYVEAAATGSALGDPIEITGLTKAFQLSTSATGYCAIGSVKSNIGHLESASGMAGLTKVLLQMRHGKLVPSIHTTELNPNIRWSETPFVVQRELSDWKAPSIDGQTLPRRACINAFGAGGSNSHLIVEEFSETGPAPEASGFPCLIVLSAKDATRLSERVRDLSQFLDQAVRNPAGCPLLVDLAFTLQTGREAMPERLAFISHSLEDVVAKLDAVLAGTATHGFYGTSHATEAMNRHGKVASPPPNLERIAQDWIAGGSIDWSGLYVGLSPRRISIPGYPFARERCWFTPVLPTAIPGESFRLSGRSPSPFPQKGEGRGEGSAGTTPDLAQTPDERGLFADSPGPLILELRRLLGAALKLQPERIQLREKLVDYGLDSMTTVAFLDDIERAYSVRLAPSAIIEHPTLESLAGHLTDIISPFVSAKSNGNGSHPPDFGNGKGKHLENGNGSTVASEVFPLSLPQEGRGQPALRSAFGEGGGRGPALQSASGEGGGRGPALQSASGDGGFRPSSSRESSPRKVTLAPMDCLFVGQGRFAIQVLYHFEKPLDFGRLREGLGTTARAFFPINSQLVRHGANAYQIRECLDSPDFEEIICPPGTALPIQDIPASFQPFHVDFNPHAPGQKLAKFRLFQLPGGSLLSANVSHAIADGYSFYYFMSSWASACRHADFPLPNHARNALNTLFRRYQASHSTRSNGLSPLAIPVRRSANLFTNRIETLHFDIDALLAETRSTAPSELCEKLTENSVITALVWKSYARTLPETSTNLVLSCPIDFRRLSKKLSANFFGNAAVPALTRSTRDRVLNDPVSTLAATIYDTVRSTDEKAFIQYYAELDRLRRTKGLKTLERALLIDPREGLIVTNVSRFQLAPLDFGSGPFTSELTPENYAGTAVIVASPGGGVNVRLACVESNPALVHSP